MTNFHIQVNKMNGRQGHDLGVLKSTTTVEYWGTQWCSWLRHCATSWKVAGSIPDGVTYIFH